jgi:predicted Ser/Thr protein kinase
MLTETGSKAADDPGARQAYQGRFTAPEKADLARFFPNLEILELLGQGGMGAVYKARQPALDRMVALKILPAEAGHDPAFTERFTREARALAKLSHPNIVTVYDFGQGGGLYYFIMEYVDGLNLREVLRGGQLEPKQALRIVPQICEALQFAHDEGVVHRDIKPENILLDKKGRVKIADFGIAKLLGRNQDAFTLTGPWQVVGTAHYMAPEQMDNPLAVDHRADIYSLGVVFYEMLTGKLPVGRFPPPSKQVQVDVRLDDVVLKSLEQEPARRYQHVSEVKTQVEAISGVSRALWRPYGYEYRSKRTLLGWPLVHICSGLDPATGRVRIAKGIIAIGDRAVGGLAIGGAALGVVAFGGMAAGLLAFGGGAIGLLLAGGGGALGAVAIGGGAIGVLALGGGAIGLIAMGGGAIGYLAKGGEAWGAHTVSALGEDPEALAFFDNLQNVLNLDRVMSVFINSSWVILGVALMVPLFVWLVQRHQDTDTKNS